MWQRMEWRPPGVLAEGHPAPGRAGHMDSKVWGWGRSRWEGLKAAVLRAGAREAAEARPQPLPHQPEEIRCLAALGEERGVQVNPCVS